MPRAGCRRNCCLVFLLAGIPTALAAPPAEYPLEDDAIRPDGIHVLDGSYVLDDGDFQINITNHGLIGSQFSSALPYSHAPSGQWPGGSGNEYLYSAGLWVGARIGGELAVTTGQYDRELRPEDDLRATIYEGVEGVVVRPWPGDRITGRHFPDPLYDDDQDGRMDEDLLNGYDDDHDGLVDEDWGQLGTQMFTCTMRDDLPLIREIYPSHRPLGITVVQRAFTWFQDEYNDIVGLDFEITNSGTELLNDLYLGFFVDGEIQRRSDSTAQPDDLAGFYKGSARGSDNTFYDLQFAWMRDGAAENPLPGWLGVLLLDHPTDFRRESSTPRRVGVRSFQIFATNAQVIQGGEPISDQDRYFVMSRNEIQRDQREDKAGDLKVLISSGPIVEMTPGQTFSYRIALVMGNGFDDLLNNVLLAAEIGRGGYMDLDDSFETGSGRRETKVCLGEFPPNPDGSDPLIGYKIDLMDETCVGSGPIYPYPVIIEEVMLRDEDGYCTWVNTDNCEECFRQWGRECTLENDLYFTENPWPWWLPRPPYFTGVGGREHHVPWIHTTELPPPAPNMRVAPGDHRVEIFWDDLSEYAPDFYRGIIDFESYRIWRVSGWVRPPGASDEIGPPASSWGMIEEFDVVNEIPSAVSYNGFALPLGRNTGLEAAAYTPACLGDPRFAGLAQVMEEFIRTDTDGTFLEMPVLRSRSGKPVPGLERFLPWEFYPDVLDTFFAVTVREADPELMVTGKRATKYYHYLDTQVHNGFSQFYSVVASDHALTLLEGSYLPSGSGLQSEPSNNFVMTVPAPWGQTAQERATEGVNIYVYPNPATNESLAEFQAQPPGHTDPVGQRIMFNNLPAAHNIIRVFTASGDLVVTLSHDGTIEGGGRSWNLMSRNGQEVGSGIYIYVVKSDDPAFEDFSGRFVVVR